VTLATPNDGSELASVAALLKLPNRQVRDLGLTSNAVLELRTEWINRVYTPEIRPGEERMKRRIPLTAVVGLEDHVVTFESARSFFRTPPPETVPGTHITMKLPDSPDATVVLVLRNAALSACFGSEAATQGSHGAGEASAGSHDEHRSSIAPAGAAPFPGEVVTPSDPEAVTYHPGHEALSARSRSSPAGERRKADLAVITALPVELDAFLRLTGPWTKSTSPGETIREYFVADLPGGLRVVAACAVGMGQLNAAALTTDVVSDWQPDKLFLIGIAAAVKEEVELGDVVVSDQIVDYELAKVTSSGTTPRWSVYRADPLLLGRLRNFKEEAWRALIETPRPVSVRPHPRVHFGVVLSGNKVIASKNDAGALGSIWSQAVAIEMEAAGVASALSQTVKAPQFVMIKGISDRADEEKNDAWRIYAAQGAAAFVKAFMVAALRKDDLRPSPILATDSIAIQGIPFPALRLVISEGFSLAELKVLAFDLGVDWDEIEGGTKSERVVGLLQYSKRRGLLENVLSLLRRDRPGLVESYDAQPRPGPGSGRP